MSPEPRRGHASGRERPAVILGLCIPGQGGPGLPGSCWGVGGGCLGIWKPDWSGLQSEEEVRSEAVGAASSDFFFLSFLQFYLHTQRRVCSRMPALFLSNLSQIREAQLQGRGR